MVCHGVRVPPQSKMTASTAMRGAYDSTPGLSLDGQARTSATRWSTTSPTGPRRGRPCAGP